MTDFPARGARLARRDDRAYREYLRKEQRSQTGCPARKMSADFRLGTLGRLVETRQQSGDERGTPGYRVNLDMLVQGVGPLPHGAEAV